VRVVAHVGVAHPIIVISYFGDMLIAATGAEIATFNDGVTGIAGVIAALEGFYNGWPAGK